jgi:predicted PurR-regulated permease PerM
MIVVSTAVILGLLSWLHALLVPIALAILLTFILSPLVSLLQGGHVPRALAVTIVVAVAFSLVVTLGWLLGRQVTGLVDTFPQYERHLSAKLEAFKPADGGFVDKLQGIVNRITRQLDKQEAARAPTGERKNGTPLPVKVVENGSPFALSMLWSVLGPVVEPIANIGFALILVIFMLMRREDLRDRVISIVGRGRLTLTTKALDEAGERISRYLLMQAVVNGSYGLAVAAGLFVIGIQYALLWGVLAGVLRYIPYLGSWIAAILPLGLSLLVSDSWSAPLMVLALFLILELITNMLIEPWLYGRGIGVSETGTLIMVAFWTWLWGPIGLVLATPMTGCLVVFARYVPFLSVLDTLLGDKPALEPRMVFYQRLLARDYDEASEIAEAHRERASLVATYDALLIPALTNARRDMEREALSEEEQRLLVDAANNVAEQLATLRVSHNTAASPEGAVSTATPQPLVAMRLLGIPARDSSDRVALNMLKESLDTANCELTILNPDLLVSEVIPVVLEQDPALVIISALPPGNSAQARLLCLRLRARYPNLKLLIGRWGYSGDAKKTAEQLVAAGADNVATSLEETCSQIGTLRTFVSVESTAATTPEAEQPDLADGALALSH